MTLLALLLSLLGLQPTPNAPETVPSVQLHRPAPGDAASGGRSAGDTSEHGISNGF